MFRAPSGSDFNPEIPSTSSGAGSPFSADIQGTYGPGARLEFPQTNTFNPLTASDLSCPAIAYDRTSQLPLMARADAPASSVEHLISRGLTVNDSASLEQLKNIANQKFDGINVVSSADKDKADFFVDRFGRVIPLNNNLESRADNSNLVVAVEKADYKDVLEGVDPKQAEIIARDLKAQQDFALNSFVQDVSNVLVNKKADGTVAISDNGNFVSPELKQELTTPDSTSEVVSQEQMQRVEANNRDFAPNVDGSARERTISADQVDKMLPQQRIHGGEEANLRRALDTIASIATNGQEYPESHVSTSGDGRVMVGRYGLTSPKINDWLGAPSNWIDNDESMQILLEAILGHPQKSAACKQFAKQLLNNKQYRQDFAKFMKKLAHGQQPTAEEVKKFLSSDLQKQIASDLVKKYDAATGGKHNIADIAEMWASDGKKLETGKSHKALRQDAETLAKFSDARASNKERKDILCKADRSAGSNNLDLQLVEEAKEVVQERRNNKSGQCLGGVQDALAKVGYGGKRFASAYMMADYVKAHPEKFIIISHEEAEQRKGAITVFGRSAAHKHGHIAIYGGNGRDLCDKNYKQMTQERAAAKGYGSGKNSLSFVLNPEYKQA